MCWCVCLQNADCTSISSDTFSLQFVPTLLFPQSNDILILSVVCVYVYVRMYVCMYVYVCMYICMYVCVCMYVVCMCVCIYVCVCM